MTASNELTALPREIIGKSSAKLGHMGQIPAILYGRGRDPLSLAIDRHDFELFSAHHSGAALVELKIEGEKKPVNAMVREIQRSPIKGNVLHVDFVAVSMTEKVHASLPLHLLNDPAGVRAGGVLTINLHELSVEALPGDLPEFLEWDVAELEMGDTLNVGDVKPPKGIEVLDDAEAIIASVQAPRVEVEEAEVSEAAEPELIGAKDEAEE
jgi:large subunit ribosomal protein L25